MASHVAVLRFEFPTTENNDVGYREIDVFGVPKPASLCLLFSSDAGTDTRDDMRRKRCH